MWVRLGLTAASADLGDGAAGGIVKLFENTCGSVERTTGRRSCAVRPTAAHAFRSSMVLAPEAIARRNAAAIEPDRIQTRCRDDGARAQVFATIEQVSRTAGLVGPASDFLSEL